MQAVGEQGGRVLIGTVTIAVAGRSAHCAGLRHDSRRPAAGRLWARKGHGDDANGSVVPHGTWHLENPVRNTNTLMEVAVR